jgi:1-acyl-sn-glycerol-3-phosphate acyltransferase
MDRETLKKVMSGLIHLLTRTEYVGLENIPPQGGVILAINHLSQVDSPLLYATPTRNDISALVANKYRKFIFFRWILDTAKIIWLDRENADFGAMRAALDYLRNGGALGVAPEGTRSKNGGLIAGKAGTVMLAERADVPIVPIGISGSALTFPSLAKLKRACITLRFGKPFRVEPLDRSDRENWQKRNTDELMCRIAAQLPQTYWGVYAGHPRLLELLADPAGI